MHSRWLSLVEGAEPSRSLDRIVGNNNHCKGAWPGRTGTTPQRGREGGRLLWGWDTIVKCVNHVVSMQPQSYGTYSSGVAGMASWEWGAAMRVSGRKTSLSGTSPLDTVIRN